LFTFSQTHKHKEKEEEEEEEESASNHSLYKQCIFLGRIKHCVNYPTISPEVNCKAFEHPNTLLAGYVYNISLVHAIGDYGFFKQQVFILSASAHRRQEKG